jgi:cob(I)alamin adenosyltransferase
MHPTRKQIMKVREKLFVMLALIVVLLILVSSIAIISMLEIQTQQEKMQTAYTSLKSILMSYNHAVSDISSYVHTSCHNEYLASFLRQHDTYAVRTSIRLRLDSILSNSPYLEDILKALNRMSSMLYILMIRLKKEG